MLKDVALCKNTLMFDPWAKILLSLKQTHMLATANYCQMWHSSFLLRSPGWNDPAQQRPFGKYIAAEVRSTRSGLPDGLYKDLHNHRNRLRWRNIVLNESQIHMARQTKLVDFPKQRDWCWPHREKRPYQGLHRTPRELLTLEDNPFLKCLLQEEQFGT